MQLLVNGEDCSGERMKPGGDPDRPGVTDMFPQLHEQLSGSMGSTCMRLRHIKHGGLFLGAGLELWC